MRPPKDIFTRMVHGIRLRYAAVALVFLVLSVGLFHLGGPWAFGWHDFFAVFVLVMLLVTLFLMHCHSVIAPIERLTQKLDELLVKTLDSAEPLRIAWSGRDEFACLAASMNGLLEAVQSRSVGLLEENHRLKAIVSSVEVELVAMSRTGTVLGVIHCPESMDPVPGLERGKEPDAEIWGAENCAALKNGIDSVLRDGRAQTIDLAFRSGGGNKTRRMRAFIRRPKDGLFPLVIFRDDDAPRDAVRAADRKVPLSRIAAGIAGDLGNVFAVIRNAASKYESSANPAVRETIETIYLAISSGQSMMEELKTLGGETQMRMRRVNVARLIESARVLIGGVVEGSGAAVTYDVDPALPDIVADVDLLGKVFVNLARNSVEAFDAVPGKIDIRVRSCELSVDDGLEFTPPLAPGNGVLVSVADDGPGMQEHVRAHIFEPYCSTRSCGRGLGLAISSSIVAAHCGGMRVISARGSGTEVQVFLRTSSRPEADVGLLLKEFPGGEVLVVDDSKSVLRITAALLRTQKVAAHVADCRSDAIRKFGELSMRLRAVFLDAQLGDAHSVSLLANMRSINPAVPIIVVSGYERQQVEKLFAETKPDAYLMKPYTVDELKDVLFLFKPGGGGNPSKRIDFRV